MSTILDVLCAHAATDSARIALDPLDGAGLSYSQLGGAVEGYAANLRRQHEPGRPVAVQLDHGVDLSLLELSLLEAGRPVLSLPNFFSEAQFQHAVSECGATAFYLERQPQESVALCRTAPSLVPPGTARITFTSGSTGRPKGVCLSAEHMFAVARSVVDAVGAGHAGRHLALLPPGILLETVAGFFSTLLAGGTYVCPPQAHVGLAVPFRPDFRRMAEVIAEARITSLILVPEYLAGLVRELENTGLRLPGLTLVAVGGARTAPALIQRARSVGLPVRQGYGLTECGSVVSLQDAGDASASVGSVLGHLRASIASDGEIMLDGPTALGTIGNPWQHGPLATGDIGRIDEAGRLWIDGRKSNLIVTSFGRNIAPEWVEEALLAQPEIAQAMVYGDGLPAPEVLLVPSRWDADLGRAVESANSSLPVYARVAAWREAAPFTPSNGQLTANGRLRRDVITRTYLSAEQAFFSELEAATLRQRLAFLAIPQVGAGLKGEISRSAYIAYLTEAWHHVRQTVPLMQAARAGLLHRPDLVAALDDYIAEEIGHDEWILADIAAAGGDADAARSSAPAPATGTMVDHAFNEIRNGNPVALFGMVYVLESVSVALAERGAAAVGSRLGLPPEAFRYLTSHGALDQHHLRFFAGLMNDLADRIDRDAVIRMARDIFALYGAIFASIDVEAADVDA